MSRAKTPQMCSTHVAAAPPAKSRRKGDFFALVCAVLGNLAIVPAAAAGQLTLEVQDATGAPLADAVVYAVPEHAGKLAKASHVAQIEQIARKYQPLVTALQVGSQVSFPNHDTVRHHVYSFSAAKKFEMKLYSGVPSDNVLFDKPGTVVLGCNIHDKMIAYIHVVETPYFSKTNASGKASISNLPSGKYHLKAWHYAVPQNAGVVEQNLQMGTEGQSLSLKLPTKANLLSPATANSPNAASAGAKSVGADKDPNY